MGEDCGDIEASWAFDVHEVRVGGLYETLQLVLLRLGLGRGVEEIDGERHDVILVWEKPFCLRRPTYVLCAESELKGVHTVGRTKHSTCCPYSLHSGYVSFRLSSEQPQM